MDSNAKISSAKWDTAHKTPDYRRRFLLSIPWARDYLYSLYLGEGKSPIGMLKSSARETGAVRALELAGGRGDLAMAMLKTKMVESIHLVDVSNEAVRKALQKAESLNLTGFTAEVADVNSIEIEGEWDFVVFSQSLHHIESLEHVLAQVKKSLKPGGFLYVNDYIGPTRMQWSDFEMDLMNRFLAFIPERLREELNIDGTVSGRIKSEVRRIPLHVFEKHDPSEAVRSADIEPVLRSTFSNVDFHPLGGAISYEIFRNIAHNFHDDDPLAKALIRSVLFFEHDLTKAGALDPAFGVFLCS